MIATNHVLFYSFSDKKNANERKTSILKCFIRYCGMRCVCLSNTHHWYAKQNDSIWKYESKMNKEHCFDGFSDVSVWSSLLLPRTLGLPRTENLWHTITSKANTSWHAATTRIIPYFSYDSFVRCIEELWYEESKKLRLTSEKSSYCHTTMQFHFAIFLAICSLLCRSLARFRRLLFEQFLVLYTIIYCSNLRHLREMMRD